MNKVEIKNITKSYGKRCVLNNISLSVKANETIAILGQSGCGKTTLLKLIAGLEKPNSGQVLVNGVDVTSTPGKVSYMPQDTLLFPYKTVLENVTLPLILSGKKKSEAELHAKKYFEEFFICETENKYPHELSGGTRQRVAFLRTYMQDNEILVLDEPFIALDSITKTSLHEWYLNVITSFKKTTLLVTHDAEEALLFANTIYILSLKSHQIVKVLTVCNNQNLNFLYSDQFFKLKKELSTALSLDLKSC